MKYKELSTMVPEELKKKQEELLKELMKENTQIAAGTVPKSPAKLKTTKKTLAKIRSILERKS